VLPGKSNAWAKLAGWEALAEFARALR